MSFEHDIRIRLYDDRVAPDGVVILAEDITEGFVYENSGVKITAFEVDHTPVKPAFGSHRLFRPVGGALRRHPHLRKPDPTRPGC
jgi:hypothetical protein